MKNTIKFEWPSQWAYTVSHHTHLHVVISDVIENSNIPMSTLYISEDMVTDWKQIRDYMTDICNKIVASPVSADMKAIDKKRNQLITNLFTHIRTGANSISEAKQYAANRLMPIVNAYKNLQSEAVKSKTTHIFGLVFDLEKAVNAPHITTLGLEEELAGLKSANTTYHQLYLQRNEDNYADCLPETKLMRKSAVEMLRRVFACIEVAYLNSKIETDMAEIRKLVRLINGVIADFQASHNQHISQVRDNGKGDATIAEPNGNDEYDLSDLSPANGDADAKPSEEDSETDTDSDTDSSNGSDTDSDNQSDSDTGGSTPPDTGGFMG